MRDLRACCLLSSAILAFHIPAAHAEFVVGPFGTFGEGGQIHDQTLSFGTSGSILELDAFVNIGGQDLNGVNAGTSHRLSSGSPAGLSYSFGYTLSTDRTDLLLTYRFVNGSGAMLHDVQFLVFVDAEINTTENYTDEFGISLGSLGLGVGDPHPDSWEIDEPGYAFGNIVSKRLSGNPESL